MSSLTEILNRVDDDTPDLENRATLYDRKRLLIQSGGGASVLSQDCFLPLTKGISLAVNSCSLDPLRNPRTWSPATKVGRDHHRTAQTPTHSNPSPIADVIQRRRAKHPSEISRGYNLVTMEASFLSYSLPQKLRFGLQYPPAAADRRMPIAPNTASCTTKPH